MVQIPVWGRKCLVHSSPCRMHTLVPKCWFRGTSSTTLAGADALLGNMHFQLPQCAPTGHGEFSKSHGGCRIIPILNVQWVKKLPQCLCILERLAWFEVMT